MMGKTATRLAATWTHLGVTAKIFVVFLTLSGISLLVIGSMTLMAMNDVEEYALEGSTSLGDRALNDSKASLERDAEEYLLRVATDQAAISNALFERVEAETNIMTGFASSILNGSVSGYEPIPARQPAGGQLSSTYVLAPGCDSNAVREELRYSRLMDQIFAPLYANDPNLAWVYVGTASGILRMYPRAPKIDPSYDPRTREWYKRAVQTGNLTWSEPYVDVAGRGLMVTCSRPVHSSNDDLFWVIGADVTVETVNQNIINTQIGNLGYAFLVDDKGNIVARPGLSAGDGRWDESFETENLALSDNPELRSIAKNMTAGKRGVSRCQLDGGEKYIAYAPVRRTSWSVGVVMPVEEVIAPALETSRKIASASRDTVEHIDRQIRDLEKIFIGLFVALIALVSGLSLLLARTVTAPLVALKEGSEIIGGGDLDYRVEVRTGDEFEDLANSFNEMASDLKDQMEELRRTTAVKERMENELEIAREIQQSFLPRSAPRMEGIDLAAFNQPAMEVGGDFYDFIPISEGCWGIAIADVSDKGVPAALFMALSRTLIRASAAGNRAVVEAIKRANDLIYEDSRTSMFVTLFYAVVNSMDRTLTYVNAGHNPPILLRGGSPDITLLKAEGIALGVMDDIELEAVEVELKGGDLLVLYTDGVTEAINENREEFGLDRMVKVIGDNYSSPAREIIDRVLEEVADFTGDQLQFDDITLMVLKAK